MRVRLACGVAILLALCPARPAPAGVHGWTKRGGGPIPAPHGPAAGARRPGTPGRERGNKGPVWDTMRLPASPLSTLKSTVLLALLYLVLGVVDFILMRRYARVDPPLAGDGGGLGADAGAPAATVRVET